MVAFGLADDETGGAPEPFAPAFAIAWSAGLIAAPHGGEHVGPESVRGALDALGARRIQHGVRAAEDPDLVARLADQGITLDVCPRSNVQLGVYGEPTFFAGKPPLRIWTQSRVRAGFRAS